MSETIDDRTESPTPRRRQEARRRGHVAQSRDLQAAVVFLALSGLLFLLDALWEAPRSLLHESLVEITPQAATFDVRTATARLAQASWRLFAAWWPIVVILPAAGMFGWIVQRGWLFVPGRIAPDPVRLNPMEGLSRMLSLAAWRRGFSTLLKFGVLGGIAWLWAANATRSAELLQGTHLSRHLAAAEPQRTAPVLIAGWRGTQQLAAKFAFALALGLLGWGLFDFLLQRRAYERELSMTRRELQEELAQQNLDPAIRDRLRSLQQRSAGTNRQLAWGGADCVLHAGNTRAVALRFRPAQDKAPSVVDATDAATTPLLLQVATSHAIRTLDDPLLTSLFWTAHAAGQPLPSSACSHLAARLTAAPPHG